MQEALKSLDELFSLVMIYEKTKSKIITSDLSELKISIAKIDEQIKNANQSELLIIKENLNQKKLEFMKEILLLENYIKEKDDNLRT